MQKYQANPDLKLGLIQRPSQNIDAQIIIREKTRKNEVTAISGEWEIYYKYLTETMRTADRELEEVSIYYDRQGNMRTMNLTGISGRGPEDTAARIITIKKSYDSWKRVVQRRSAGALIIRLTESISRDRTPPKKFALNNRMGYAKVIKLLQYGLNDWCIIRGWGNQIEGTLK